MNKTMMIVVAVLVLLGVGYYVMKGRYAPGPGTQTNQPETTAAPATPNTVTISGFAFSPTPLTVKQGTTVTWVNQDSATHNIKSSFFNSKDMDKGGSVTFTFSTKGTFTYNCGIHPSMVGTVIVE